MCKAGLGSATAALVNLYYVPKICIDDELLLHNEREEYLTLTTQYTYMYPSDDGLTAKVQ